jgi:hypothetical protein
MKNHVNSFSQFTNENEDRSKFPQSYYDELEAQEEYRGRAKNDLDTIMANQDFEGLIESGTPLVQIIPFKREDWKSKFSVSKKSQDELFQFAKRKLGNRYKTFYRTKKVWE